MDRVRRISLQIVDRHPSLFTTDFERNKELLGKVVVIRSKELRNEVAGYITKLMKGIQSSKGEGKDEMVRVAQQVP